MLDEWVERPCPVCGGLRVGDTIEEAEQAVLRHVERDHGPRTNLYKGFPRDAVLTVGKSKTQYRLGSGFVFAGHIPLNSIKTGRNVAVPEENVRWDGVTFWSVTGSWKNIIFTDQQTGLDQLNKDN